MKLLVIISSHVFETKYCDNIKILDDYMKNSNMEVDYCGICNSDEFSNYEHIIKFKYKIINTNHQLTKLCEFITDYRSELDYTWYMKFRPEIKLLDTINFDTLSVDAINGRARVYHGPSKIKYGMSVGGVGCWDYVGDCYYAEKEHGIIIDALFLIFHKNTIDRNAFDKIEGVQPYPQTEWTHTDLFNQRKIPLNVVGINLCFTKYGVAYSKDINM
jgi:hypothetical protein